MQIYIIPQPFRIQSHKLHQCNKVLL